MTLGHLKETLQHSFQKTNNTHHGGVGDIRFFFLLEMSLSSRYAKCVFMVWLFTMVFMNYREVISYLGIQGNATY